MLTIEYLKAALAVTEGGGTVSLNKDDGRELFRLAIAGLEAEAKPPPRFKPGDTVAAKTTGSMAGRVGTVEAFDGQTVSVRYPDIKWLVHWTPDALIRVGDRVRCVHAGSWCHSYVGVVEQIAEGVNWPVAVRFDGFAIETWCGLADLEVIP